LTGLKEKEKNGGKRSAPLLEPLRKMNLEEFLKKRRNGTAKNYFRGVIRE